jgi:hypothetical protein
MTDQLDTPRPEEARSFRRVALGVGFGLLLILGATWWVLCLDGAPPDLAMLRTAPPLPAADARRVHALEAWLVTRAAQPLAHALRAQLPPDFDEVPTLFGLAKNEFAKMPRVEALAYGLGWAQVTTHDSWMRARTADWATSLHAALTDTPAPANPPLRLDEAQLDQVTQDIALAVSWRLERGDPCGALALARDYYAAAHALMRDSWRDPYRHFAITGWAQSAGQVLSRVIASGRVDVSNLNTLADDLATWPEPSADDLALANHIRCRTWAQDLNAPHPDLFGGAPSPAIYRFAPLRPILYKRQATITVGRDRVLHLSEMIANAQNEADIIAGYKRSEPGLPTGWHRLLNIIGREKIAWGSSLYPETWLRARTGHRLLRAQLAIATGETHNTPSLLNPYTQAAFIHDTARGILYAHRPYDLADDYTLVAPDKHTLLVRLRPWPAPTPAPVE